MIILVIIKLVLLVNLSNVLCNCPSLQPPINGQIVGFCNSFPDSRCWIKCNNNQTLYTRVCTRYGFWSGNQLICSDNQYGSELSSKNNNHNHYNNTNTSQISGFTGVDFNFNLVKILLTAIQNAAKNYSHPKMVTLSANATRILDLFANSPAFITSLSMVPVRSFVTEVNGHLNRQPVKNQPTLRPNHYLAQNPRRTLMKR